MWLDLTAFTHLSKSECSLPLDWMYLAGTPAAGGSTQKPPSTSGLPTGPGSSSILYPFFMPTCTKDNCNHQSSPIPPVIPTWCGSLDKSHWPSETTARGEDVETQVSFVTVTKFHYEDMKIFVLCGSSRFKNRSPQHSSCKYKTQNWMSVISILVERKWEYYSNTAHLVSWFH